MKDVHIEAPSKEVVTPQKAVVAHQKEASAPLEAADHPATTKPPDRRAPAKADDRPASDHPKNWFPEHPESGIRIREMPTDEQPREKLIRNGAGALSNGELLAILLRTGTRKMNVLELSRSLNTRFGGLRELIRATWLELSGIPGMGTVKAVTLEAAFELARRIQISSIGDRPRISCPEDAAAYFAPFLRDLNREVFMMAFLNHSKYLTSGKRISEGGMSATVVDPAEVIRMAVLHQASSFLIAHNHPSGSLQESHADVQLTHRISRAGKILGIPLEDHIIIAGDGYMSFREKGLLV